MTSYNQSSFCKQKQQELSLPYFIWLSPYSPCCSSAKHWLLQCLTGLMALIIFLMTMQFVKHPTQEPIGPPATCLAPSTTDPKAYSMTYIHFLYEELWTDPSAARENWLGRYVTITGTVSEIGSDGSCFVLNGGAFYESLRCNITTMAHKMRINKMFLSNTVTVQGQIVYVDEIRGYILNIVRIPKINQQRYANLIQIEPIFV